MKSSALTCLTSACLLFIATLAHAQSSNIFLDRDYWASKPSIEEINVKIEEGNDPTVLDNNSFDPVTMAILANVPNETAKYLMSLEGNGVNKLTHDGRTYIFWAAYQGNLPLMEYLIAEGAKTDIVDDHGYSLLNFAATTGQQNPELYDYLLANGASLTETDHHGANALLLLVPHLEDFKMVDYFAEKGLDLNSKDSEGNGVFNYTAKTGNTEMMDQLIEKGVDYKGINEIGGNAMIFASQGTRGGVPSLSVFKYLEGLGIEPNVTTEHGLTPLHNLAARARDTEVITYFIDKGVDVNQTDDEGNTPLMNAASRNNLEVVSLLTEKTEDINAGNEDGQTALTNAVASNSPEVVNYLIAEGADVHVEDEDGNTLASYLIQSYNPANTAGFEAKLQSLQNEGLELNVPQANGNTLFHLAVEKNSLDLLKQVQELGSDVNAQNEDATTPLQIAAMKATNEEILKYLIEIGASTEVVTAFDETVYDLASENELLKENGASINFLKQ